MRDKLKRCMSWIAACVLGGCVAEVPRVAVVDRIVDGEHAVLIVGDPPELEVITPVARLPRDVREGHWLEVVLEDGRVVGATIDRAATEAARDRVRLKLEKLRERGRRLE
jgi:hypothetical protein